MISIAASQEVVKCTYCGAYVEKTEAVFIGNNLITGKPMYSCQPCWNADASDEEEED